MKYAAELVYSLFGLFHGEGTRNNGQGEYDAARDMRAGPYKVEAEGAHGGELDLSGIQRGHEGRHQAILAAILLGDGNGVVGRNGTRDASERPDRRRRGRWKNERRRHVARQEAAAVGISRRSDIIADGLHAWWIDAFVGARRVVLI